jgi:hypothetical protein
VVTAPNHTGHEEALPETVYSPAALEHAYRKATDAACGGREDRPHGRLCGPLLDKVVGPAEQDAIELFYQSPRVQPEGISSGFCADGATDALHPFPRWHRAQIDPSPAHRVASPERVSQEVELLLRQLADPRLVLVHRQLQLRPHPPHRSQSLLRSDSTTDDQIIGIINHVRLPTLLVPKFLPPQHEPSHVQIVEQRTDRRPLWCPRPSSRLRVLRCLFPCSSVSSTGASNHILIRCSIAPRPPDELPTSSVRHGEHYQSSC